MTELTDGFRSSKDGPMTLYLKHESSGPDKEANCLPAPDGLLVLALRMY